MFFYNELASHVAWTPHMHVKHDDSVKAELIVTVKYLLEDPHALDQEQGEVIVKAGKGENLLEVALDHGINIEHACGGVCACSTCHVYICEGADGLSELQEDEEDRVEEAPGLQSNSRLSCQSVIEGVGPIVVQVPAWNRNAVKEVPH